MLSSSILISSLFYIFIFEVGGIYFDIRSGIRNSLVVQRLKLHASAAGDKGLIPDPGAKILHALHPKEWDGDPVYFITNV